MEIREIVERTEQDITRDALLMIARRIGGESYETFLRDWLASQSVVDAETVASEGEE